MKHLEVKFSLSELEFRCKNLFLIWEKPHSIEYDDLFTPHTSIRQRYVSDHGPSLVALFNT